MLEFIQILFIFRNARNPTTPEPKWSPIYNSPSTVWILGADPGQSLLEYQVNCWKIDENLPSTKLINLENFYKSSFLKKYQNFIKSKLFRICFICSGYQHTSSNWKQNFLFIQLLAVLVLTGNRTLSLYSSWLFSALRSGSPLGKALAETEKSRAFSLWFVRAVDKAAQKLMISILPWTPLYSSQPNCGVSNLHNIS